MPRRAKRKPIPTERRKQERGFADLVREITERERKAAEDPTLDEFVRQATGYSGEEEY